MISNSQLQSAKDQIIHRNIIDQILNGEVRVQHPEILKDLLKQHPNEPSLLKLYAENLNNNGMLHESAKKYDEVAKLYLKNNDNLSAIGAKILTWQIVCPTKKAVSEFWFELKNCKGKDTPLNQFFSRLSQEEFFALVTEFEIKKFPLGHIISRAGDLEQNLYFVVSGILKISLFLMVDNKEKSYKKPTIYLSGGDYFGDIYPFDQLNKCKSYIEATSRVELICVSKQKLMRICDNHPNIELRFLELLQIRAGNLNENSLKKLRKEKRINIRLDLGLEIFLNTEAKTSIFLTCYSRDLSMGGICVILDEISLAAASEIKAFEKFFQNTRVKLSFQIEELTISLPGKIAWSGPISGNGRKTISLGIQFGEISPKLRGLLLSFFNCFDNY
jgi:CRP-like cAMP-binding protein